MEFFKILDELKEQYKEDMLIRENGTILLGPSKVPLSRHMLYKPLDDKLIEEFLTSRFVHKFPNEYIKLLKYTNGADLCITKMWHSAKKKRIPTTCILFSIFGLPRTQPFGRPAEMEEPFDMRIENLNRHDDIPKSWLKCGTYTRNYNFFAKADIFIDPETERVYACTSKQNEIVASWDTLDECLCEIYHSFDDRREEYDFQEEKKKQ